MGVPQEVQPIWNMIWQRVARLHGNWIVYRQLFGQSEQLVTMLNRCASAFFAVVQDGLLSDVQLSLSRLADPPRSMGRPNATLATLISEIEAAEGSDIPDLRARLEEYRASCEKIKARRNKYLAHYDYEALVKNASAPLDGPSRHEIEQALAALRRFMSDVESHFGEVPTNFEHFISRNDGTDLVWWLKRGLRHRELEESGQIEPLDLRNSSLFTV
jgi:hypothetical protein